LEDVVGGVAVDIEAFGADETRIADTQEILEEPLDVVVAEVIWSDVSA